MSSTSPSPCRSSATGDATTAVCSSGKAPHLTGAPRQSSTYTRPESVATTTSALPSRSRSTATGRVAMNARSPPSPAIVTSNSRCHTTAPPATATSPPATYLLPSTPSPASASASPGAPRSK